MGVSATSRRLAALLLAASHMASASPFPRDDLHDLGFSYLMPRACASYCGVDNDICCSSGQTCTTLDGNIATCVGGGGGGGAGYQVTTWTETHTYTSTIMTYWDPVPEPTEGVDCIPANDQQEACGPICCAGWQSCAFDGQCSSRPGYEQGTTVVITSDGVVTTQYSAPYRVTETTVITTSGVMTTTSSGEAGATETGSADGSEGGSSTGGGGGSGLSGGEIAGIVIGSIAGAILIGLILFCCIVRGIWGLIFGGRKKEERHSHYDSSGHSRRDHHSGWFGGGRRTSSHGGEKKSSGKKWLGLAGLAATLLALLNLKKDKPARKPGGSRYSDSYYSYSYSSPTSSSSGRRTHRSRRTGMSRGSRAGSTYYSKSPRR